VTALVLDSSVTIAWFMPDEHSSAPQQVLERVADDGAIVPMLWALEVGNALLFAVRRNRISTDLRLAVLTQLAALPLSVDPDTLSHAWSETTALADRFRLTLYDACYLELALRRHLPLASLDGDLRAAARALNIPLLGA
jgi:predicted nucleic acid-binding protein